MPNEIKDGRLHVDGQRIPLSMDEARSMKNDSLDGKDPNKEMQDRVADVYGRMRTAQSMGMESLMPSDAEFKALDPKVWDKHVAETQAKETNSRADRLKDLESRFGGIDDKDRESPLAEYGIY